MKEKKIAYFDIETAGVNAFYADLGWAISASVCYDDEKIVHNKMICDFPLFSVNPHDDSLLIAWLHSKLSCAEYISGHYAEKFDRKFLNSRIIAAGLPALAPVKLIDTWRIAKCNLKLSSNRLASLAQFLHCEHAKIEKKGGWPSWWYEFLKGKVSSKVKKLMRKYNNFDVLTQRDCANKLKAHWPNAVYLTGQIGHCRNCTSSHLIKGGYLQMKSARYQRIKCTNCGTWDKIKLVN